MMKHIFITVLIAIVAATSGCGYSGGGETSPIVGTPPVGGIGRTGIASGPITTFGSIVVNGVRYETNAATFTIDGAPGSQDDLRVGQIVTVKGTIDDDLVAGTADEVTFDENVKGPVQSIDTALSQLVVLGQTVLVGADTSFDDNISPASIEGLQVGDIVEVSGFVTASGEISATRLELKPAGTAFEVHGQVSNLDPVNFLFSINSLQVDYSAATLDNFPSGQITEGDLVEAKGNSLGASNQLIATKVELENAGLNGDNGDHAEVEGLITRFAAIDDFDVAGFPVTTNTSTVYEGGVAADLGLNIKVEVEGDLDANGVLVAEKVDIRRARSVRAVALVDSVDVAADSVVMLGITFSVDELTRIEDKSNAKVDPLTIADINAGDYLEIRGSEFPAASGQVLAALLEREDIDTETKLQGFVETVADPSLTVLGVTITTNAATVFRNTDDSIVTAAQFFTTVGQNSLVKAKGTETGSTSIVADELELQN